MSQVKSLENMAAMTQSNLVLLDNLQTLTAAGLVGQEVKVTSDALQLSDEPVNGVINLEHAAGVLSLVLTDSRGVSKEINLGSHAPGAVPFSLNANLLGLAPGSYQLTVNSDSGEYPKAEIAGRVKQVRVSTEGPVLDVAGVGSVPFYNITEFGQAPVAGLL
jgi:flagellar basal-body rod modification protein FlgD